MVTSRPLRRPLLSLSVPLLVLAGGVLAADRSGTTARLVAGTEDVGAGAGGAGAGGDDASGRSKPVGSATPSSTTTTVPPTPATAPTVTEPPTTAPPTTSAQAAAPVTEVDPGPSPAPEPDPSAPPEPEPEPEPQPVDPGPPPPVVVGPPSHADIQTIVNHHNARRGEAGLPPLSYNGCLAGLAANWAAYLSSLLTLLHQADLGGVVGRCIDWRAAGENVGYATLAADVADGFWGSAPHRRNILDAAYTEIGVGVAYADGRIFVTVLFGG